MNASVDFTATEAVLGSSMLRLCSDSVSLRIALAFSV